MLNIWIWLNSKQFDLEYPFAPWPRLMRLSKPPNQMCTAPLFGIPFDLRARSLQTEVR